MPIILLVLVLVVLLGAGGFAWNVLWYLAAALLIVWIIGFFVRIAGGTRWYRW
ncbi:hydrophobic protein [Fodinicola acaciae]|uniref:hydrophobic protein n=1 Tax=Fodinicola acaciae TaxID=2681555 RepID=UPI0013CF65E7|nr:hydrophobic protein [Fodinicola acaciae]